MENNIITVKVGENEYSGTRNDVIVQVRKHEKLTYREIADLPEILTSYETVGRVIRMAGNGLNERIDRPDRRSPSQLPRRRLNLVRKMFGADFVPGSGFEAGFAAFFEAHFRDRITKSAMKMFEKWDRTPMQLNEFAKRCGISEQTVINWIKKKQLTAEKRLNEKSKKAWFILDMDKPDDVHATHWKNHYVFGLPRQNQIVSSGVTRHNHNAKLNVPESLEEVKAQLLKANAIRRIND